MSDVVRLLLMVALAGAVLTAISGVFIWYMDEERSIRRGLRRVLGADPDAVVIARGRGRGAAFSFASGHAAVAWDSGAWCLVYKLDELIGAELLVDGHVVARAYRGEPRRPLDQVARDAAQVTLRLVFDDPRDPDFDLDLWLSGDDERRPGASAAKAVQEANRWMARAEAIFRRPLQPRAEPSMAQVDAAPPPPLDAPETQPSRADLPAFTRPVNAPPWDPPIEEPVQDAEVEEIEMSPSDDEDWDDLPRRPR